LRNDFVGLERFGSFQVLLLDTNIASSIEGKEVGRFLLSNYAAANIN
jgi:hypothetical protein